MDKLAEVYAEVQLGHFLPGGQLLDSEEIGVNETYRGVIEVDSDRIAAYVKLMQGRQLINELVASVLGRLAGLKIPRSFLVLVDSADYPSSPNLQEGTHGVAFATEAVAGGMQLRRFLCAGLPLDVFLSVWKEWPQVAAFDEWIANEDRHAGNVLLGGMGEVWPIDHSHSFMGPNWTAELLGAAVLAPIRRNLLCDEASKCLSASDKSLAYVCALDACTKFARIIVPAALGLARAEVCINPEEYGALRSFIEGRVAAVEGTIGTRLGLPGLGFGVRA